MPRPGRMEDGYGEREPSVVDVYDAAAEIGKEFERLIDAFGAEAVTGLMPKVIVVLEQLERFASKSEREDTALQELRASVSQLEHEKAEKAEQRQRFERELEQIEDHWRKESEDLVAVVTRLQDENRKLSSSLKEKEEMSPTSEVDVALVQRLKKTVDKQREQMRHVERELSAKSSELENIQSQVERLTMVNKDLRRKHKISQMQVRNLIDERADLQGCLQDQQRELMQLRQQLGLAQKENEDLIRGKTESPELKNKVMYDLDDPNRPRFTTAELKEILHDRNELKARVSDLEDELDLYRPRSTQDKQRLHAVRRGSYQRAVQTPRALLPKSFYRPWGSSPPAQLPAVSKALPSDPDDEEPPVQGPLPCEPDDAPWKRSESGIRKLFRKLFGDNGTGESPKRSLNLFPKMAFGPPSPNP